MYFYPLKSMTEMVRQSSIDLSRQAVVKFFVKKVDERSDKYLIVVHTLVSSWLWTHNNAEPFS